MTHPSDPEIEARAHPPRLPFPSECTPVGEYRCQVPMPITGRIRGIDICIADIVAALNAANIPTDASCCGHGEFIDAVILGDGRVLEIYPNQQCWEDHRKKSAYPKACLRRE